MRTTRQRHGVPPRDAARIAKPEESRTIHVGTVDPNNRHVRRPTAVRGSERRSARVQSAVALSGNLKARVRADLIRLYGPLRVSFVEIPALSGGMRITVGSDLYYGSVSSTLAVLEDQLQH